MSIMQHELNKKTSIINFFNVTLKMVRIGQNASWIGCLTFLLNSNQPITNCLEQKQKLGILPDNAGSLAYMHSLLH
jgi:hypothetical protein